MAAAGNRARKDCDGKERNERGRNGGIEVYPANTQAASAARTKLRLDSRPARLVLRHRPTLRNCHTTACASYSEFVDTTRLPCIPWLSEERC
jgi:hypothetical protein